MVTVYGVGTFPDPTLPYGPLIAVYTVAAHCSARTARVAGPSAGGRRGVAAARPVRGRPRLGRRPAVRDDGLAARQQRPDPARLRRELAARADDLERERHADAERAVAEERVRIARELHDVAAHHVSVIALHAEAGQARCPATRRAPSARFR